MKMVWGVLGASSIVVSGCTTSLVSEQVDEKTLEPANGLMYRLPKKQFDVTVTYEFVSCSVDAAKDVLLGAKVSGTVVESLQGDDTQTYFLDYAKLAAPTKISNIDVGVSDTGMLTSINSVAKDQTGPIMANVGATVFSIARSAVLPGVSAATVPLLLTKTSPSMFSRELLENLGPADSFELRKATVAKNLCAKFEQVATAYEAAKDTAKSAATLVKDRGDALDVLTQRKVMQTQLKEEQSFYKQYGTDAQYDVATASLTASSKALVAAQRGVDALASAPASADAANKKLGDLKAKLVVDHTFTFTPSVSERKMTPEVLYSRIDALFDPTVKACVGKQEQGSCVRLPSVTIQADPVSGYVPSPAKFTTDPGIVYRLPATARLLAITDAGVKFIDQMTQIPQYGHIASLNLKNGPFADNLLKITFSANGTPSTVSFSSQSQAEAASKAASATAQSYFDFAKNRQQDKIDSAKTQITLDKDRASANASVSADNLNTLRDIQKLQALASGTSSATDNQLDSLKSQRDMLEVQLRIIALQKQISDAKAGLIETPGQ